MDLYEHKQGLEMSKQDAPITEIVQVLEGKRDTAVSDRSEVESRWLRDLQQFEGNTLDRISKGDTDYRSAVRRSPPVVHLTRTRTLSIAARIINMLVPSNERSWDISSTPVPSMVKMMDDNSYVTDPSTGQIAMVPDESQQPGPEQNPEVVQGAPQTRPQPPMPQMRPVTKADLAKQEIEDAEKRADHMRTHMDDQLTESRYNSEQRKVIMDGCKIGTGVLEGPVVAGSYKKARHRLPDGQWVVQMEEEPMPEFKCIDPWSFYPLPAEHISRCEGVFIDQLMNRREIQELRLLPGFDHEMIAEVLKEQPNHSGEYSSSLIQRANVTGETMPTDNRYSVWKYTGSLNREDMENLGVDVDDELDIVDPIIEAWFCNTRLLKIKRHALEGAYRLPYYVWNYEESETTVFGYGVPYFMRDSDRVIQSTWHMILHNAALSAGPMLVRDKGAVEPADGSEEIAGGMKQWYLTDPEKKVNDAFQMFQIDTRIDALTAVHERARQNADEELSWTQLAQGAPTEAETKMALKSVAMLINTQNVIQRRIAQSYDDEIIEPSISALYDYNMIYLDDDEAKGDMTIKPMGATKLVVKDMQTQNLIMIADMTTNDRFAPYMKDDKLLKSILKAAEVDADDLMKSEEEMKDAQKPSEKEMAELNKLKAEAAELMSRANGKGEGDGGMSEKEYTETQLSYDRMEVELKVQDMKLQGSAIEAAKSGDIKLSDIQSKFELGNRANETKLLLGRLKERREELTKGYMASLEAEKLAQTRKNMEMGFDSHG